MCSILKVGLCAVLLLAGGCELASKEAAGENAELNPSILPEDPAMRLRNWPQIALKYENTGTMAYPTEKLLVARDSGGINAVVEPFVYITDVAVTPLMLVFNPPFKPTVNRAVNVEPSYTAVPPVPMK